MGEPKKPTGSEETTQNPFKRFVASAGTLHDGLIGPRTPRPLPPISSAPATSRCHVRLKMSASVTKAPSR